MWELSLVLVSYDRNNCSFEHSSRQNVNGPVWPWFSPNLVLKSLWSDTNLLLIYSWSAPDLIQIYSRSTPDLLQICSWSTPDLIQIYSWSAITGSLQRNMFSFLLFVFSETLCSVTWAILTLTEISLGAPGCSLFPLKAMSSVDAPLYKYWSLHAHRLAYVVLCHATAFTSHRTPTIAFISKASMRRRRAIRNWSPALEQKPCPASDWLQHWSNRGIIITVRLDVWEFSGWFSFVSVFLFWLM